MNLNKSVLRKLGVAAVTVVMAACGDQDSQQDNVDHMSRAKAYQEQGQYKAAMIEYKNAVKKSGGSSKAIVEYADMLNDLGQSSAALDLLEKVTDQKDEGYYLELVETFQGMSKYRSASDLLTQHFDGSGQEVKRLIGRNHLGMSEFGPAIKIYESLIEQNPKDYDAILGKASAFVRTGKVDESVTLLKSIEGDGKAAINAKILLAGIQINQDQLDQAEAILSDMLSSMPNTDIIEPEKAVVLERLAYVLTRQGRSNEAYIYTKLLAEAYPGANEVKEQYQAAVDKLQSNEMAAAKGILTGLLEKYPGYDRATQLLGVISYLEGDNQSASKYLSDSVDPETAHVMATHIYAATNLKLNEPRKVLEILEPGIGKSEVPATLALYGLAAISDKQYSKGEKALLKALKIQPENIRVRLALAGFYRLPTVLDLEKEWEQLERSYEIDPDDKQVLEQIVGYRLRQGKVDDARAFLNKALTKNKDSYAVNLVFGYFSIYQRAPEQALEFFTAASLVKSEESERSQALFAKGRAELALKKVDAARKTFLLLVQDFPEDELGYKGLLSTYQLEGKIEEGQKELERLGSRNAKLAPYLVLTQSAISRRDVASAKRYHQSARELKVEEVEVERLGHAVSYVEAVIEMKRGNFTQARSMVASILSSQPDDLRLLSFLVELEIKAGNINEASKVLTQMENLSPSHPAVSLLKGDLALAKKDLNQAKLQYTEGWKNNPSEVAGEKLYRVLGIMGNKAEQNKHVDKWLAANPNSVPALLYKSLRFQIRGQRLKAMELYERLLELAPNHAIALNNLGWIYFEKKDKRALKTLEKAHKLAPENAAILDSYGWVLVQEGQLSEGIKLLEKANSLAPGNKEIAGHLEEAKKL